MDPVSADVSFPRLEEKILAFWRARHIFENSLDKKLTTKLDGSPSTKARTDYIFYDGPPFATGLPHYGHLLAGTIKDVVGRFFTMKGSHVDRRFGWDCHGVPVEFEVQKALNLHGAKAIREFGVAKFNEECRKIVLRYTKEWQQFVERSGRWVDFTRQYRTMDLNYMESIWWVIKCLWDRGLLYESVKCVPYSWAINTPLSNFEANLNYQNVQDPAITVRVKLEEKSAEKLGIKNSEKLPINAYIWTTTPWTLPSNLGICVRSDLSYSIIANPAAKEIAIVATARREEYFPELADSALLAEVPGSKLRDIGYEPIFPYFMKERARGAFRIFVDDFVTAEDGTGVVHLAAFGEDDVRIFLREGIPLADPVDEDGRFTDAVSDFSGLNVKEADPKIIAALKAAHKIVSHKTIEHSYPFCWRTDTPLIYKAIPSWFVKVETLKDVLIQNNQSIHWVPEHIRDGRFGKWLEGARDWAISRNRFWGTPLPIWSCDQCQTMTCLGSVKELVDASGEPVTDLHSHFIDSRTWKCASCSGTMRRVPHVLDCWFESGAMPYAQAHYPFEGKEEFEQNFPADFIAEGLDQCRGWFYTLSVLSTALLGRAAFKNVIVNGIVLAEDGKKMSKSLKNYPPPDEVMNEFGADAMRLYLLASAATRAEELRFSKVGVKDVVRQTLLPLWNAYNFFVTYALVDLWTPAQRPAEPSPNLLDQWLISKVSSMVRDVDMSLSSYRLYAVAPQLLEFVDQLTNWYIRLNRRRFWAGNTAEERADKWHAYATLHHALLTFVRALAPLAPFISEEIFLNLAKGSSLAWAESVHLLPFPNAAEVSAAVINEQLEHSMELFEEVIVLGRTLRNERTLKVRQPLAKITIIHPKTKVLEGLRPLEQYIADELNVKEVHYSTDEERFVTLTAKLNTKKLGSVLGPKLGADGMKRLRGYVETLATADIRGVEEGKSLTFEGIEIGSDSLLIERKTKSSADAVATNGAVTIVLDTTLTQELRLEGLAREFVNRVQKLRKEFGFEVTDRIVIHYMTACPRLSVALVEHRDYVTEETLAVIMEAVTNEADMKKPGANVHQDVQEIEGKSVFISLTRVQG